MRKIVVAGSINMDVVVQTDNLPSSGETIFGHDLHYIPGGKGSNQFVQDTQHFQRFSKLLPDGILVAPEAGRIAHIIGQFGCIGHGSSPIQ